jgi:hypothetical protein
MNQPAPSNQARAPILVRARLKGRLKTTPVELDTEPFDVRRLAALLGYLAELGWVPELPPVVYQTTPDGLPVCPRHGVPMRRREKQGDEWHSHKVIDPHGQELYCRGYDGPDSPGYRVESER